MKKYDFDQVIDRSHSCCLKYESLDTLFGRHDLTPLWIADLDFAVCPEITNALSKRLEHPVYGYSAAPESYWQSITKWLSNRHGIDVKREELTFIPGVVKGIALVVNYFTKEGDKIVIQPPVYHPFKSVIEGNHREVLENPLVFKDNNYEMDLDALEALVKEHKPKLMILCNPHNPVGIQWEKETMARVAKICKENGVVVVSDEIHGDLMLKGKKHITFTDSSDEAKEVGITLGAPSKSFNIPGLVSSWMFVKNPELREPFYEWLEHNEFNSPVMTAVIGAEAAYTYGEEWLNQMLEYVESNIDFVQNYLKENIPDVSMVRPQASFLVWLDFRNLHLTQPELMDLLIEKAHLALNDGTMFGHQGKGFMRLNVGTPRKVLQAALEHVAQAVNSLVNETHQN